MFVIVSESEPKSADPVLPSPSRWFEVERLDETAVVVRRTGTRMEVTDLARAYEPILAYLEATRPAGVLVDLRDAPGRNDDAYEQAVIPFRRRLLIAAPRVVVLVRMRVGALQVARHARADGVDVVVTHDPDTARRHVLGAASRA